MILHFTLWIRSASLSGDPPHAQNVRLLVTCYIMFPTVQTIQINTLLWRHHGSMQRKVLPNTRARIDSRYRCSNWSWNKSAASNTGSCMSFSTFRSSELARLEVEQACLSELAPNVNVVNQSRFWTWFLSLKTFFFSKQWGAERFV